MQMFSTVTGSFNTAEELQAVSYNDELWFLK